MLKRSDMRGHSQPLPTFFTVETAGLTTRWLSVTYMYRFERSAARTPFAALSHRFQARHARSTGPLAQHTSITVTTVGTAQRLSIVPHKDTQTLLRKDHGLTAYLAWQCSHSR